MKNFMLKLKITCPECNGAIILSNPVAEIWERCPSCGLHVWDTEDMLMAEAVQETAGIGEVNAIREFQ